MIVKKFLVIGDIYIDAVINANEYPPEGGETLVEKTNFRLGGSGCNTAVTLSKLGTQTWLAGNLGTDPLGTMAINYIRQAGLQFSLIKQRDENQTGFFCIVVTGAGERTMFVSRGSNALPLDMRSVNNLISEMDHLHISGYTLIDNQQFLTNRQLLNLAIKKKIPISLDPGVCTTRTHKEKINEILPFIDYLLISQQELSSFSNGKDEDDFIHHLLLAGTRLVVLKRGAEGSQLITLQGQTSQPAFHDPQHPIQDTTGAGDAFNAGFLFAQLNELSSGDCLALGNLCAFRSIISPNGTVDICQEQKYLHSLLKLLKDCSTQDKKYESLIHFLEKFSASSV